MRPRPRPDTTRSRPNNLASRPHRPRGLNIPDNTHNNIELSVFHINIRSLNKNHGGLSHLLQLIDLDFDVIVLSEIWKYSLEFYKGIFRNYNFYYAIPDGTSIGGVGTMYVKKNSVAVN